MRSTSSCGYRSACSRAGAAAITSRSTNSRTEATRVGARPGGAWTQGNLASRLASPRIIARLAPRTARGFFLVALAWPGIAEDMTLTVASYISSKCIRGRSTAGGELVDAPASGWTMRGPCWRPAVLLPQALRLSERLGEAT